jgi:cysteinyl-tRNA synthetase
MKSKRAQSAGLTDFFLFNTLTRTRERFAPQAKTATLYTCGPTVYATPHLGNWRTFVFDDLLRRFLSYRGYQLIQAMNLTDVDDKTIAGATAQKVSLAAFTDPFIKAFHDDRARLGIEDAEHYPRATEYIAEMARFAAELLERGFAYQTPDGSLYFSVKKFRAYGLLAHLEDQELRPTGRVKHDEYEKEEIADFALWKAWDKEDGDVFWPRDVQNQPASGWPASIPKGRPGWHIECSAMLRALFGASVDLHTGGVDNIFPHHQNEIAQSEALTGKPLAHSWLHVAHLTLNGEKMAKSKGNITTLEDVVKEGFDPLDVRYLLLSAHYRQPLDFTEDSLKAARGARASLRDAAQGLKIVSVSSEKGLIALQRVEQALLDDLNVPKALAVIHTFAKQVKADPTIGGGKEFFEALERIFGLGILEELMVPQKVKELVAKREEARTGGNFVRADELRQKVGELGFRIEDTPNGVRIFSN